MTLPLASESTAALRRVEKKTGVIIPFSDWVSGDFPKGMGMRCDVMMTYVSSPPRKINGRRWAEEEQELLLFKPGYFLK